MKFLSIASVATVSAAVFGSAVFAADVGSPSTGAVVTPKPAVSAPAASASAPIAIKGTTRQAYLDQAAKRFDTLDANHDGILTGEERKAHNNGSKVAKPQGASSTIVAPAKPSTAKM